MNRRDAADLAGTVGLGAWVAFGVLTIVVIGQDGAQLWSDDGFLAWSLGHRPDVAEALARGVTDTGSGAVPYVLAVLAGMVAGRTVRRRMGAAALGLACLGTGQALRYGVMEAVQRPRPARTDWAASAGGWAFPSGHTTTAALTAGLLIIALHCAPRAAPPHSGSSSGAGACWWDCPGSISACTGSPMSSGAGCSPPDGSECVCTR